MTAWSLGPLEQACESNGFAATKIVVTIPRDRLKSKVRCALAVSFLFGVCVLFKLNGSSVGIWDDLYGHGSKTSKSLLLFKPQKVRSDEWQVWTPAALSQSRQSPAFPIENFSLGGGRAPLLLNLPVAYYTTLFRPQLWGFFLFDFERGFSFAWCAKIFGLLLATGWFLQQLGVRSRGLILFGSIWVFLGLQWWFSSPAMVPEMFATWAICTGCAIQFLGQTNRWRLACAFVAFVYCGINFVLCMYPPLQVPLLFSMLAIFIGVLFERRHKGETCSVRRAIVLLCAGLVLIAVILVPFWIDIRSTLELVSHTVYPGARRNIGGTFSFFELFSGIASFFQTEKAFPTVFPNICAAQYSFPLWPLIVVALIVARFRHGIEISPLFISLAVLIAILAIYCVVPLPNWLLRVTLLSVSHPLGAMGAIGLANGCMACLFLDRYRTRIFTSLMGFTAALGFCTSIVILLWTAILHHPGLFPERRQIVLSLLASAAIVVLFFWERRRSWLPATLIALVATTTIWINPVMSGLSPLVDSPVFKEIDKIRAADPKAKWLVYYGLELSEFVRATGANVIGGTKIVPDLELMHLLDPENRAVSIYNRYAHVLCRLPASPGERGFTLLENDLYVLEIDPDLEALEKIGCRYFVFPDRWPDAELHGFALLEKIADCPIWIYRRQ
ncbi:MAG: hypothetical protein ABI925_09065 [Verrucomicrobiota bacterium]